MNFFPKDDDEVKHFKTDVMLREKESGVFFSDKLRFIYLSLPFFKKTADECETDFERWIYVLKPMELLDRMPFVAKKKIFERLAEIADSSCLSQEDREKYEESQKVADDWYSSMYGAWEEGKEKGLEEGIEKGETRKSLAIAKKMLLAGLPDAQIMDFTGLTQRECKLNCVKLQ